MKARKDLYLGPKKIQGRLGPAKQPWLSVCSYSCWHALKDPCTCKCGGAYHGLGVKKPSGLPGSIILSIRQANYYKEQIKSLVCRWCTADMSKEFINGYPHSAGWRVAGQGSTKYWLYITCPRCTYDWALWKLGVARE